MRGLAFVLFSLFLMSASQQIWADDITITYSPARIGEEYGYWYGQASLSSSVGENVSLDLGDTEIVSFSSGFTPIKKEGEKVYLANPGNKDFEALLFTPRPSGHGLYKVSFTLPEINKEKNLKIKIKEADKVLFSNINFTSHKEGGYLVLEAKTNERNLSFRFLTKPAYMVFADTVGAGVFTLILLGYVSIKRKKIKEVIKSRMRALRRKSPLLKKSQKQFEISLTFMEYRDGKLFLRIPFWFLSGLIIIFLGVVFFFSVTSPLGRIWHSLGVFKAVVVLFALVLGILATLLLISAKTDKELALRFGIIGAGIIGSMFGHLGIFALVLAITTCLLIYFLSVLLLEEEK